MKPSLDARRSLEPGEVSAEELLTGAFPIAKRGYSCDVMDTLLERAAMTIARLRSVDPNPAPAPLPPPKLSPPTEQSDLIQRTLLRAQATADETVAAARSEATALVADAELRAKRLIADAERIAAHAIEAGRAQARFTLGEAVAIRDVLQTDISVLERFVTEFRARLRHVFESEAAVLGRLLSESPAGRPTRQEIDVTSSKYQTARAVNGTAAPADSRPLFDGDHVDRDPLMAVYVPDGEPDHA